MGTCSCCCGEKQTKSIEIATDIIKTVERQDKFTQSDMTLSPFSELSNIRKPDELIIISQSPVESEIKSLETLKKVQSLFRWYLENKKYKQSHLQLLSSVPTTISTIEAKQAYAKLLPFKYEKHSGDEPVSWKGPTKLPDGSVYVGEWNTKGLPHGKGIMYYFDGGICEGHWNNGKLHDKGRRVSPNGDVYTGQWNEGKMEGNGTMEYANKIVYNGFWKNDKQNGTGNETWPDGSKFEGEYKNGLKNGKGRFLWPDGTCYQGEFINDVIHGFGKYTWQDKEYEVTLKNGKMDGKGVFRWKDGKVYDGEYSNDLKDGWGVFVWPNGRRYEGMWKDGKQHGEGTLVYKTKKRRGVWENGDFVKKIKENEGSIEKKN